MAANSKNSKGFFISNYHVTTTIGQGTFGKVKLGIHNLTGEKVAVKILEKEKIHEKDDLERVAREISILKILRHPNIIQLYEIIETPKHLYLILEYASGGELFDYIVSHQRIREVEACRFYQQMVSGIEYLSKLNIVHRDLKPENLLIDKDRSLKIADFGLSNTYKTGETLKTACGSPCYAAPEMIQGDCYSGTAVDIWSSGIVLYAMLCGFLPFDDPNTANLYKKIVKGEYQVPKFLSESASSLISGILNVDSSQRFTLDDIKAHKWFKTVVFEPKTGLFIEDKREVVDEQVVEMTGKFGIDLDLVRKSVERNKHNHASTVYYLIKKKWENRETRKSPSLIKGVSIDFIKKQEIFKKIEPVRKKSDQSDLKAKKDLKINKKLTITRPISSKSPIKMTPVGSKPSTPSKSTRNSVSPGKKSPVLSVYSGPYDVECITGKSLSLVIKSLNSVLSYLEIKSSVSNYKYKCLELSNLTIEVCRLQGTNMHLVKFDSIQNNTHVIDNIINLLDL